MLLSLARLLPPLGALILLLLVLLPFLSLKPAILPQPAPALDLLLIGPI